MNKKGVIDNLLFQVSYVVFASAIGLAVLYFVFVSTSDTSLQTKIYQEDLKQTINKMLSSPAIKLKVDYELPEHIKFNQENNKITLSVGEINLQVSYQQRQNAEIKFTRNKNSLIMEKNEKIS
ncbi:MAG: hypothetical protein AABW58_00530 [Nanoarchaeota archaeon]